MGTRHSTAKAILDYAVNISKYLEKEKIKIFVEDNFRHNDLESISLYQYNSSSSKSMMAEHRSYLQEYGLENNIEIYYSNTRMEKRERIREMVDEVAVFNPDIMLNINNSYSLSMEFLSKHYKSYYLTLGLINWQDNQIYNFYSESFGENTLPNFKNNVILKTNAVSFEKKEKNMREVILDLIKKIL